MTASEVRERQAEFVAEQQRRMQAQRQAHAARYAAAADLALLGQSQIRIEPGAVNRVPPADWQNVFDEGPADAPAPEPPTAEIEAKAKGILWSYLNRRQREDLFCVNYFIVTGSMTGMVYRIVPGMQGNIYRDDGARYCVTNPTLPSWDLLLAQKLMLEDDEGKFLTLARRLDHDGAVRDEPALTSEAMLRACRDGEDGVMVEAQPELETVEAMTRAVLGGPTPCDFAAGEISPDLRRPGRSVVQILRDSIRLNR